MDRKDQPKRRLNDGDSSSANKRVKETKTTVCDYTHPVKFKDSNGEIYKIHVNILTKSIKLRSEVKHIEDLPEYYSIPYFNDRLCNVLNYLLTNRIPPYTHETKDIMLCRFLCDYNISLIHDQCTWLAKSSMYVEEHKYKFNNLSYVKSQSQMATYIVNYIITKCKIKNYIWLYDDMQRELNNNEIYNKIMRNIFAMYQNS